MPARTIAVLAKDKKKLGFLKYAEKLGNSKNAPSPPPPPPLDILSSIFEVSYAKVSFIKPALR